jgi:GT2 family glycosyltransferase
MRFSIIVPSLNRPQRLSNCLTGLAALDYPRDHFEVLIVDDGSTQPLDVVAQPFRAKISLQLLRQDNAGPARARNLGARSARGELLAFIDDDCVPERGWLRQFDRAAALNPGCLLGGATTNACRANIFAEANNVILDAVTDWLGKHNSPLQFFASNNIVVPARDFREIGGFDSGFRWAAAEDRDFCQRWRDSGRRLIPVPDARIDHFHPQTLHSFFRMHFRYGRGAARLHKRHKTSPLQFVSSGLYMHMLAALAGRFGPFLGAALMAAAQVAAWAGFCWEKPRLDREASLVRDWDEDRAQGRALS